MLQDKGGHDGYHIMWFTPRSSDTDPMVSAWIPQPSKDPEGDAAPKGPRGTQFVWHCNILDEVHLKKNNKLYEKSLKVYKYFKSNVGIEMGQDDDE